MLEGCAHESMAVYLVMAEASLQRSEKGRVLRHVLVPLFQGKKKKKKKGGPQLQNFSR